MAELDLGKVKMTDAELMGKILTVNGGVRFGKDADGKPGFIETDAETGEETVIPFGSGGGGGIEEFKILRFHTTTQTASSGLVYDLSDIIIDKKYKNILLVASYYCGSTYDKNVVNDIIVTQRKGNTLEEIKKDLSIESFRASCACLFGEVNEDDLTFRVHFSLTNTSSVIKAYSIVVIGIN